MADVSDARVFKPAGSPTFYPDEKGTRKKTRRVRIASRGDSTSNPLFPYCYNFSVNR